MNVHPQPFAELHVDVHIFIHRPRVAVTQVGHAQAHRLLVELKIGRRLRDIAVALPARWHGVHVLFFSVISLAVLLDTHRSHREAGVVGFGYFLQAGGIEVGEILAVLLTHHLQLREAKHDGLREVGQVHSHEANGLEAVDLSHFTSKFLDGHSEQVPVGSVGYGFVHNKALSNIETIGFQVDLVFVVGFVVVDGIVHVQVLGVGQVCGSGGHGSAIAVGSGVFGRVAFHAQKILIAFQDFRIAGIQFFTQIKLKVVARRVGQDAVTGFGRKRSGQTVQETLLEVRPLLLAIQAIETDVLLRSRARFVAERVDDELFLGHAPPGGAVHVDAGPGFYG